MRKTLVWGILLVSLVVAGCAGNKHLAKDYKGEALREAPEWVLEPEMDGMICEVGVAPPSPAGFQFQRTEALANARDELSRKINLVVNNTLKQRAEQADNGKRRKLEKVTASISDQISNRVLSGSMQKNIWIAADGTMFVLVGLDRAAVEDILAETEIEQDLQIGHSLLAEAPAVAPKATP